MIVPPADEADMDAVEIVRGPNIKPFPKTAPLPETVEAPVLLKVGDNITTDHIMPAGAKILPLRSNIPAISEHCFVRCDEEFPARCKKQGKGIIIGGSNYGQAAPGSTRPWRLCIWASRPSLSSPSPASMWRTSSTPASCL